MSATTTFRMDAATSRQVRDRPFAAGSPRVLRRMEKLEPHIRVLHHPDIGAENAAAVDAKIGGKGPRPAGRRAVGIKDPSPPRISSPSWGHAAHQDSCPTRGRHRGRRLRRRRGDHQQDQCGFGYSGVGHNPFQPTQSWNLDMTSGGSRRHPALVARPALPSQSPDGGGSIRVHRLYGLGIKASMGRVPPTGCRIPAYQLGVARTCVDKPNHWLSAFDAEGHRTRSARPIPAADFDYVEATKSIGSSHRLQRRLGLRAGRSEVRRVFRSSGVRDRPRHQVERANPGWEDPFRISESRRRRLRSPACAA